MTKRSLVVTVCLTATVGMLVGLIIAGSMTPATANSAPRGRVVPARLVNDSAPTPVVASFADIAERLNPTVVNINATSRGDLRSRRRSSGSTEGPEQFGRSPEREREGPRRGAGTGFLIDAAGNILTNHHVIDGADRITVRLTDGRTLRAERVGSDPDTDIALIKVESPQPLPFARLGNSDALRVGEWVVAIGNPLAYEHTVTVGVVSFIGRKLFDSSLDRYIQTDAAINFGNSGGPLINARGEVIGINAAISSRASNIGFAVPINQASAILSQLKEKGRVARGFIGVNLRGIDPDLQSALGLRSAEGALVQDVTPGSPGERAGIRTYDVIISLDGESIVDHDGLIARIAARQPGTTAALRVLRDGRALTVAVKLAERPQRDRRPTEPNPEQPQPSSQRGPALGMAVRELDRESAERFRLPDGMQGVLVWRVEPMSPAYDADVERGHVLLEIDRQPVHSLDDYRRLTAGTRSGDILTLYIYRPDIEQRVLHTVKVE